MTQLVGLRLRPEELCARFGIRKRLAVRLGALLARGLTVTATLVEVLAEDEGARDLVQSRRVLELAADREALSTWLAGAAAAVAEASDSPVLALGAGADGAPVLCLEEELLAASVWNDSALPVPVADPGSALVAVPSPSAGALLERRELPALERAFRTAADGGRRVEALTQLVTLGRLDSQERAGLLMEAMAQSKEEVARSALALLETAGLPRSLAEALRGLEDASLPLRLHAIDQLRTALAAGEPDPLCLAAVLLVARRVLWNEPDLTARRGLVLLLGEAMRGPVASPDNVDEVVRTLVKASLDAPAAMSLTIRRAVLRLAVAAPAATAAALTREAAALGNDEVAVYILALLGELPMQDEAEEERFCGEFVRRVFAVDAGGTRPNLAQLLAGLRHRGLRGVAHVVELLPVVHPDLTADVVSCIDRLAASVDLDADGRARIRAALLDHLERATPACTRAILGSSLLDSSRLGARALPADEARLVARELVARMQVFLLPDVWGEVTSLFGNLGAFAFEPLAEMLVDPSADPDLLPRALDLMAHSFAAGGEASYDRALRKRALALLCDGAGSPEHVRGALIDAAGALTRSPAATPSEAIATARVFGQAFVAAGVLGEEDATAPERVHLAACLAGRPDLGTSAQEECEATFAQAMSAEPVDEGALLIALPEEEKPWTGCVYQATGAELRYTVTLPSALRGLGALAEHSADGRTFRRRFLLLHAAWERIAAEDLWGPDCTRLLLCRLADLAASEPATAGVRKRFLETLTEPMHLMVTEGSDLPVVQSVATLLERSPRALQRAHAFRILGHLAHARREALALEEPERRVLLDACTRLAALRGLEAPSKSAGERLATQITNQVRVALRAGSPGADELAERLRTCTYLTDEQRDSLTPRTALARIGS